MTQSTARPVSAFARQVLAPNPGPMTLDGTQSYVLAFPGAEAVVVVDPGPDDAGHLAALAGEGAVELVLVTHRHPDHTEGIDRLHALTGAPVRAVLGEHCRPAAPGHPLHGTLAGDGDPLRPDEVVTAAGLRIRVLATPGHTSDSVCFLLPDDGPHGAVLTGDTILGRGTTILDFPDGTLGDYLESLDRLTGLGAATVLPAHGPVLPDLAAIAGAYRAHRFERLRQVRDAVVQLELDLDPAAVADDGGRPAASDVRRVADVVYADVDSSVRGAAEHSVAAQLSYLATLEPAERAAL
ncbi:MBL fold metallo-hydrolase [Zhihengliuella sp.]|uniref:MBL fold metallo-hydrolase n=1 Tax=Zhihengliuella sp. TaxID=1954483 RepID=UPI002811BBBE|nr:MBL fold metallo-hydrolase [Zhihengliuella sp.]